MKSPSSKEKKIRRTIPASPRLRTSNKASNREGAKRRRSGKVPASTSRASLLRGSKSAKAALRKEFRELLPTALERDTLLTPEWVAESVVQETERYLGADLPPGYAERLAAKAHYLYPRHKHFHKMLNRPGNRGRHNLFVFMRHWTCSWLKRERYALYKKLPWSFAIGVALYPQRRHAGK